MVVGRMSERGRPLQCRAVRRSPRRRPRRARPCRSRRGRRSARARRRPAPAGNRAPTIGRTDPPAISSSIASPISPLTSGLGQHVCAPAGADHLGVVQQQPVDPDLGDRAAGEPDHDHPAALAQRAQAVGEAVAADRVEHDVDAAARELLRLVLPGAVASGRPRRRRPRARRAPSRRSRRRRSSARRGPWRPAARRCRRRRRRRARARSRPAPAGRAASARSRRCGS